MASSNQRQIVLQDLLIDLGKSLELEIITGPERPAGIILHENVRRPGLALAGFHHHFDSHVLQILGLTEIAYLSSLEKSAMTEQWTNYLALNPPGVIVARSLELDKELLEIAEQSGSTIIRSSEHTEKIVHTIDLYLERNLAPTVTQHGVLMDIYGIGTLIIGESGVGKSESALGLLERGHRLVSNDAVQIRRIRYDCLVASSPDLTRHHMEIRGLGLLNIQQLHGAGSVVDEVVIELIVHLETWKEGFQYDRLGLDDQTTELLGIHIPKVLIPVQPGRNLAVIIEVGARNQRLKKMGVNSAKDLSRKLDQIMARELEGKK